MRLRVSETTKCEDTIIVFKKLKINFVLLYFFPLKISNSFYLFVLVTSLHLKYNVYTSLEQDAPPHVLHGMYCLTWLFHVNLSWKGDEVSVFDHNSHTKFARPILMKYNIIILHWYKQMVDSINLMLLQFQD